MRSKNGRKQNRSKPGKNLNKEKGKGMEWTETDKREEQTVAR
jgi:hypothetical protein